MKEARYYTKLDKKMIKCLLCNHQCVINNGKRGICNVRENREGILYSLIYGKLIANNVDPIEKKPLFHFYPGTKAYSIATIGCNFNCLNCQNWSISQVDLQEIHGMICSPKNIVNDAINNNCKSIAYTYTEPTIFYEFAYDIAKQAHKKNLKNIFVTNGYISKDALIDFSPYLDGANIDLKSMNENFYRKICGAKLKPVLENIKLYHDLGIWLELTTLVIPGYNDDLKELKKISEFIANIDKNLPWHITAFHPSYKLSTLPSTNIEILKKAVEIGKKIGLKYIYQGNVNIGENTICPKCNNLLLGRYFYKITENNIEKGKCKFCGLKIDGKWI